MTGTDATGNTEDELQKYRRLEQALAGCKAPVDEVCQVVGVPHVVTFVFELRAVALAEELVDSGAVTEAVAETRLPGPAGSPFTT